MIDTHVMLRNVDLKVFREILRTAETPEENFLHEFFALQRTTSRRGFAIRPLSFSKSETADQQFAWKIVSMDNDE